MILSIALLCIPASFMAMESDEEKQETKEKMKQMKTDVTQSSLVHDILKEYKEQLNNRNSRDQSEKNLLQAEVYHLKTELAHYSALNQAPSSQDLHKEKKCIEQQRTLRKKIMAAQCALTFLELQNLDKKQKSLEMQELKHQPEKETPAEQPAMTYFNS